MKQTPIALWMHRVCLFALLFAVVLALGCASSKPDSAAGSGMSAEEARLRAQEEARRRAEEARLRVEEARRKAEDARLQEEARRNVQQEGLKFEPIYFDFDRAIASTDQRLILARHAARLKAQPDLRMRIEGHCDERGTIEYNLALGQKRADSVWRYLVQAGVNPDRLETVSFGEERPAIFGHNEYAWAKNRRAEFVVSQ